MQKLTIDRARCHNGSTDQSEYGRSSLLNSEGMMCCLGFRCIAECYSKKQLLNCGLPSSLCDAPKNGMMSVRERVVKFVRINDNPDLSNEKRENQLIELAAEYGEEWEFIGESP